MRALHLLVLTCLVSTTLPAQNLVPNPGFENHSSAPDNWGQWDRVQGWTNAGGTPASGYYADPDYFHVNGSGPVQLPDAAPADLSAHGGDGVMGFLGYHDPTPGIASDIREYLSTELTTPLQAGRTYELRFWVSNGDSNIGHYMKCNGIGALLSMNAPHQNGASYFAATPQFEVPGELWSVGWTEQILNFTADSAYRFLTIGNFMSDGQISVSVALQGPLPFAGAYYFIDDVSLADIEWQSAEDEREVASGFALHPNPVSDWLQIDLDEAATKTQSWRLTDLTGRVVEEGKVLVHAEVDMRGLPAGMYLVTVDGRGTRRVVRQ